MNKNVYIAFVLGVCSFLTEASETLQEKKAYDRGHFWGTIQYAGFIGLTLLGANLARWYSKKYTVYSPEELIEQCIDLVEKIKRSENQKGFPEGLKNLKNSAEIKTVIGSMIDEKKRSMESADDMIAKARLEESIDKLKKFQTRIENLTISK